MRMRAKVNRGQTIHALDSRFLDHANIGSPGTRLTGLLDRCSNQPNPSSRFFQTPLMMMIA
jgi:hypothetical protein